MDCPACHSPNIDGARFCAKCGALLPAAVDAPDPLVGTILDDRYRITGVLGEGGMGRVYTAERQMGTAVRKVAVKTLLAQYAKDPEVLARFRRECGTVSELEHPNTIRIYDWGQTPTGELYIAMEFLDGRELEKVLEGGPLPPERVDRIVEQVCGSLQEAHEKGIVHRDLKPANVFLTKRGGDSDYVKVLDFGIAKKDEKHSKAEQKLTKQGTVLGTPPYMSPEQFKGQDLDARSDVYSLGVMVYEMLTGRLPFDADTPWAWATQHMTAQPFPFETVPIGNQVPQKMRAAVMRALSKDRNQRQQSVREFYEELTLGTPRLSALGLASHPSLPEASGGGTAMMQSRPSGGQTQMGEPLYASTPQPPVGRTVVDSMPSGAVSAHPPVPTGSGQVLAPQPPAKKGGAGAIIAGVAVVGVLALVIGVVAIKKKGSGAEGGDVNLALPTASASAVVAQDGPAASAQPSATPTVKTVAPVVTATQQQKTPTVDSKAEKECEAAQQLASRGNVSGAVGHYRGCDGPGKVAARIAIDQAGTRAAGKGCAGLADARAAASIGASSGLELLKKQKCR